MARSFICARCGGEIDGDDEDMCAACLGSMAHVAVDIPADFDPDPDACERGYLPYSVEYPAWSLTEASRADMDNLRFWLWERFYTAGAMIAFEYFTRPPMDDDGDEVIPF